MKFLVTIFSAFLIATPAFAQSGYISCRQSLSGEQIQQIKSSKRLLGHVKDDPESTVIEIIENSECPAIQVMMLEAMAQTYADLIQEYELDEKYAQQNLYGKIQMGMAYLQFTGGQAGEKGTSLARLIQRKLRKHLPADLLTHPEFYTDPFEE